MKSVIRNRGNGVNPLEASKISVSTLSGSLDWKQLHSSFTVKAHSISNTNPVGNYVGIIDRDLVAGTDVDKFDFTNYNNASLYIGVATSNKAVDNMLDTSHFIALVINVTSGSVVTMRLSQMYLEIIVDDETKASSFMEPLFGQTVSPMIATIVGSTVNVHVTSKDDLRIYTESDGVVQFDTTKDMGKSHPIRVNTGGNDVIITGNTTVGGTLSVASNAPYYPSDPGRAGSITWDADYLYICTALNTWKRIGVNSWIAGLNLRVLLISGGGSGGGDNGGGGGAGELYDGVRYTPVTFSITVGTGGAPVTTNIHGLDGGVTVYNDLTLIGGGGGGAGNPGQYNGNPGGSGGGGGSESSIGSGGSSTASIGVGHAGGWGGGNGGGGGGGAGGVGSSGGSGYGGVGGYGIQSDITGSMVWYAAGGGGANDNGRIGNGTSVNDIGGYTNQNDSNAVGGVNGTGSGGGGQTTYTAGKFSGAGGSGVVIVRIPSKQYKLTWTGTLTGDVSSGEGGTIVGDDWYYRFTSGTANDVTLVFP